MMNLGEIIVHEMERNGGCVILDFLRRAPMRVWTCSASRSNKDMERSASCMYFLAVYPAV